MALQAKLEIDLHGYHPSEIDIAELLRQAWETGAAEVTFIHGHGRNRGLSPGFVNTNTGYFGLQVRQAIRRKSELKPWVKVSTLDCSHNGSTTVKLRANPNPSRVRVDLPERGEVHR
jgi:creatinine amidohydrolase/Fe(II)-dependent formamide hydrolase-like protein